MIQRWTKLTLFIIISIVMSGAIFFYKYHSTNLKFPTYFKYSEADTSALANSYSNHEITQTSLKKWDTIMFDLVKENKLGDTYASRVYAYVYTSQRDAAFLSNNIKSKMMGSIEPISAKVLCLFFPTSCSAIMMRINNDDPYSNLLSEIVSKKVKERMLQDSKHNYLYEEKKQADQYWSGVRPYYGQDVGSWMTWLIKSSHEFIAPPPPAHDDPEWNEQVRLVNKALKDNTVEQITSIVFWAGNPSTITPPGIWLVYANDYMDLSHTDLAKKLFIRSILSMGIADSVITVFNSKYTYWCKRPFMRDPSIHTVMPTPNHPSYPAGHSTLSSTAAKILSYYLPENKKNWNNLLSVASEGRVWGGIHFPIDAHQGTILGDKVGNDVLIKAPTLFDNK